jgi:NitT/TauT family transport system ATP-binding protein
MELEVVNLNLSFQGRNVLSDLNLSLHSGSVYCLMGASGSGKTSFLKILMGLLEADSGFVKAPLGIKIAAVFQEDRLCEEFSPIENLTMTIPGHSKELQNKAREVLLNLLPSESLSRKVTTLSGGMKRRVAIGRALWAPSDMIVMDEPFTGLDYETKISVICYIKECTKDKLVIISTHQPEDATLLDGTLISLS